MRGTMLWFNETEEFGYISTEEGERLLVNGSGFVDGKPRGRCAGIVVSFRVSEDEGGRVAEDVVLVPEVPSRRARSHRRG